MDFQYASIKRIYQKSTLKNDLKIVSALVYWGSFGSEKSNPEKKIGVRTFQFRTSTLWWTWSHSSADTSPTKLTPGWQRKTLPCTQRIRPTLEMLTGYYFIFMNSWPKKIFAPFLGDPPDTRDAYRVIFNFHEQLA